MVNLFSIIVRYTLHAGARKGGGVRQERTFTYKVEFLASEFVVSVHLKIEAKQKILHLSNVGNSSVNKNFLELIIPNVSVPWADSRGS